MKEELNKCVDELVDAARGKSHSFGSSTFAIRQIRICVVFIYAARQETGVRRRLDNTDPRALFPVENSFAERAAV